MLITKNWNQAKYYILPPDHEETMITSLIMDGYDWNHYSELPANRGATGSTSLCTSKRAR